MHHDNTRSLFNNPDHPSKENHKLPDPPIQTYHHSTWYSELHISPHFDKHSSIWQNPGISKVFLHVSKTHQQYKDSCLRNKVSNTDANNGPIVANYKDIAPETVEQSPETCADEGKFVFLEIV